MDFRLSLLPSLLFLFQFLSVFGSLFGEKVILLSELNRSSVLNAETTMRVMFYQAPSVNLVKVTSHGFSFSYCLLEFHADTPTEIVVTVVLFWVIMGFELPALLLLDVQLVDVRLVNIERIRDRFLWLDLFLAVECFFVAMLTGFSVFLASACGFNHQFFVLSVFISINLTIKDVVEVLGFDSISMIKLFKNLMFKSTLCVFWSPLEACPSSAFNAAYVELVVVVF